MEGNIMFRKHILVRALLLLCLVGAVADSTTAQTFYLDQIPEPHPVVGLHAVKPFFDSRVDDQFTTFTATYDLYFNMYLGKNVNLRFELPYTHVGQKEFTSSSEGDDGIGNIFLGVQTWSAPKEDAKLVLSLGARLPTASDEKIGAASVAYVTDLYHIGRAFPNILTLEGNVAYHRIPVSTRDYLFGMEIGPTLLVPTEGGDPELLIHYGGVTGTRIDQVLLSIELSGLFLVTQHVPDFGDRFDHQLAFGATLIDLPVKPQLYYGIALDSGVRDVVNGVLGIRVEYGLPNPGSEWD
jgi:hypothetical protein